MSSTHGIIKLRRGTAAEWAASLPQPGGEVLRLGEPGYEKDTRKLKIGDGVTPWNSLPYFGNGAVIDPEDLQDLIGDGFLVAGTGINISYDDGADSLTISTSGVSFSGHVHLSTDITDFNSAVSGLIPVKDIVAGTGISVSSTSGIYAITSTGSGIVADQSKSLVTTVFNKTGSPIPKFTVVYINGGQGDMPTVALASASGEATSSKTYGITAESISNMNTGKVIVYGALTGINTDQFNPTAPTGDVNGVTLYLSPTTPGGVTTTKPSAPNHMVSVGTIVRTHQNEGVVEVRIQNGYELEELHNVAISGALDNQVLVYQTGVNNLWQNTTLSSSYISDFNSSVSGIVNNSLSTDIVAGTGISITYDNINDDLTISADGLVPVVDLGAVTGVVPINAGINSAIQTLSLNGTAVNFTKGNDWPVTSGLSTDTVLKMTITSPTTITWTLVTEWFNQATSPVSSGTHLFLLRGIGNSTVEGHYIGIKT